MNNSIYKDIDDCHDLSSKIPTPEEMVENDDLHNQLVKALNDLEPEERKIFLYYQNLDGKARTVDQVAAAFNLKSAEAKRKIEIIRKKLQKNKNIAPYNNRSVYKAKATLQIAGTSDDYERGMMAAVSSIGTSKRKPKQNS